MIVVPRNEAPFTVFTSDGSVNIYKSIQQLVKAIGWYRLKHSLDRVDAAELAVWLKLATAREGGVYDKRRIVLNAFGDTLGLETFAAFEPSSNVPTWFTGRRWHKSRYVRYPKTYTERRMNSVTFEEDGEVAARGARRGKNLPNDWDDRKLILQRSWKVYRHHQWKD